MSKNSSILIYEFSKENNYKIEKKEIPSPGDGEVLINNKSTSLNPVEWKIKEGFNYGGKLTKFPFCLGWDCAGTITKVGYGVSQFKVGDEVYAYARRPYMGSDIGCYQEYLTIPACYVTLKPKKFDFIKSSCVPLTGLTAYQCFFEKGKIKKSETVMILGASGGVGSWATQYSKIHGSTSICVASTKNHQYLKKLGATHTVDYKSKVVEEVKKLAPGGIDIILDFYGHGGLEKYECLLKKEGRMVGIVDFGFKGKSHPYSTVFVNPNAVQLKQLAEWVDAGKLDVHVEKVYDFKDIALAEKHLRAGVRGKIALKINP